MSHNGWQWWNTSESDEKWVKMVKYSGKWLKIIENGIKKGEKSGNTQIWVKIVENKWRQSKIGKIDR